MSLRLALLSMLLLNAVPALAQDLERREIGQGAQDLDGTLFHWTLTHEDQGGPDLAEPIITDRPDFTEASVTVGKGVFQIESGYTFIRDRDEDGVLTTTHAVGDVLLRYGVFADWFELRLGFLPLFDETEPRDPFQPDNRVGGDLYLGTKLALTPQHEFFPEMALVPQLVIPSADGSFASEELEPGVNWLYGWDVVESFSVAGSTQFNRRKDDVGDGYAEFAQSVTFGYGLADEVGAYTEWFAFFPSGAEVARVEHYANGGITYLFTDNVQADIRIGVGLNDSADDFFIGTGLSIRFPP